MLDDYRNHDNTGIAHLDRLACGGAVTPPRKHVLWRDPEEVRTAAAMTLLMLAGGGVAGALIAGALMNEAVLAFLGIW